ncbi:MAG: nucleoside kinase [Lentihominibacter sp.]
MKLKIKKLPGGDFENITIGGVTEERIVLADLAETFKGELPYPALIARVNGLDTELTETVKEGDTVELLDMREHCANLVYQRSLSMIFLKAFEEVFGEIGESSATAEISNTLNNGFFISVRLKEKEETEPDADRYDVPEDVVKKIETRMHRLVEADLPFNKEIVSKEEGVKIWEESGRPEKARLLKAFPEAEYKAVFYSLNEYRNYFFGPMVPSTGYIKLFELRKYRKGILLRFPYYGKPDVLPEYVDDYMLYKAYGEEYKWLDLLGVQYLADLNNVIASGGARDMILMCEALYEKRIVEIAAKISGQRKRIILIAGPSSAGKTTTARRLCIQLKVNGLEPLYLGTDDYFLERKDTPKDEKGNYNFENLDALDINLFNNHMNNLLAGREVDIPEFDFVTGTKVFGKRITSIDENQPIIIEGIHALNDKLTEQIDDEKKFKIYISPLTQLNLDQHNRVPTTEARMLRRMVRDYNFRDYSAAETIRAWPKVRAGENLNIFPFTGEADIVLNSVMAYEIGILKKYAEPLLREITPEQPEYSEALRLLDILKFFAVIEEEDCVPNNSIVREFIGGSVFVG